MNWPPAKCFLAAESIVPKRGNCSASPFPDADTLKKKVIFKKDFWLNFVVFRTWLRVWEGQNPPLFWSWYPWSSFCGRPVTSFWESCKTTVTLQSSLCHTYIAFKVHSCRLGCRIGPGKNKIKPSLGGGSVSFPIPLDYFWLIQRSNRNAAARRMFQSSQMPYLVHKTILDSVSHLWVAETPSQWAWVVYGSRTWGPSSCMFKVPRGQGLHCGDGRGSSCM